jgi:O-antigen ligase
LIIVGYVGYGHSSLATIQQRVDLWADTIRGFKIFGNGIGSFEILYPLNAVNIDTVLTRPKYAHNDLLQIGFDLGIGSLLLVAFLWSILTIKCKEAYILYAFCIVSLFAFPLHNPVSAFLVCLVAGFITRIDTSRSVRTN